MLRILFLQFGGVSALSLAKPGTKLNFVWMFPDTLRAESFSSYGLPLNTTPVLDEFAKTAVRFEQAHVLHTQCAPSRVAMLTGRFMHVNGHRTQFSLIQANEFNYFRAMKEHGYHIQYYGKNDVFSKDAFALSVSNWTTFGGGMPGGDAVYSFGEAGYFSMLKAGSNKAYNSTDSNGDMEALTAAINWILDDPPQPFVLFLPTMGAHPPYGAPKFFNDMWSVDSVMKNIQLRPANLKNKPMYHSSTKGIPFYRNITSLSAREFARIQATYLGMISYVDWMFGQLLQGIEASGLEDNTVIIFSSDHGDFAGDYRMVEKWPGGADDILTRVPLYIRVPHAKPAARGFVAQAPVSSMDIPHTMCKLAGIDVSDINRFPVNFGTSLISQAVHGIDGDARFVFAEGGFSHRDEVFPMGSDHVPNSTRHLYYPRAIEEMSEDGNGSPRWIMIRNQTHKMVYRGRDISELYDFTDDPQELNNLIHDPEYAALKESLTSKLMSWMLNTSDVAPLSFDDRTPPSSSYTASQCSVSTVIERPADTDNIGTRLVGYRVGGLPEHNMITERGTYDLP